MKPAYDDVKDRVNEKPKWFTMEGYPRYCEFEPGECDIYARYSTLMVIRCQNCPEEFRIGSDYSAADVLQIAVDTDSTCDSVVAPQSDNDTLWVSLKNATYLKHRVDNNGKTLFKSLTLEDIVKNFVYGDPPSHGCIGDTMCSIRLYCEQAWDRYHGKKIEDGKIIEFGSPTRIKELEGYEFEGFNYLKT